MNTYQILKPYRHAVNFAHAKYIESDQYKPVDWVKDYILETPEFQTENEYTFLVAQLNSAGEVSYVCKIVVEVGVSISVKSAV